MSAKLIAVLAAASLASGGVYAASTTRAADVLPAQYQSAMADGPAGGNGPACAVNVVRSGQSGVARVTRGQLPNSGGCVCTVTTGPEGSNGNAENVVTQLLQDRSCDGAPPAGETNAGGGGGSGGVLGGVIGAVAVGGLAGGLGAKSSG